MADGDGVGGRTGPTMPAEQIAMPPAVAHPNGCRELGPSRRAMQEHRSPAMAVEMVEGDMRLGLVGYGFGGRFFHAPFIVAAEDVELVGVVTRSPSGVPSWPGTTRASRPSTRRPHSSPRA